MAEGQGDKKHFATDRRREQAREEGQITKSADLSSAAMLLISLLGLYWLGGALCESVAGAMIESLSMPHSLAWTAQDASQHMIRYGAMLAIAVVPVLSLMFAAGIAVNVSQTGLIFNTTLLAPNLNHINPLAGVKRITSIRGMMRLGFGIVKVLIIAWVAYAAIKSRQESIVMMWSLPVPVIAKSLFECLYGICIWIAAALLVVGVVEYGFQWWRHEEDLKMSDQELRDEMKESNGNPQVQARRKQIQRQMMMQRINTEVPKADFIATNPTELAIAISYDPETMIAPVVVAKGAGAVAQKIRKIGLEHGIPIVERKELAQYLYKNVEVGQAIGIDQYQAVAELLRYVYQLKGKPVPKLGQRKAS
ncbi:MAG: EscU/YscU/HrcU family type III secretion system export apparatus switch protein [Planctomycetaceae bacterium]